MARASDFTAPLDDAPDRVAKRIEDKRTLVIAGINHALHDGYTDLIYVLLPVWQAEFGLDYVALALLRSLYNGALAALQMPASRLAQAFGARTVLVLGTLLSAGGYALAGASGGLIGLCVGLLLGGAGSSTQHPLASTVIARAYGAAARGPLGTYNFAGDLGKAAVPPLVGFLLTLSGWRTALWVIAGLGVAVALGVGRWLPREARSRTERAKAAIGTRDGAGARPGFGLLVAIGILDNAARPAFLLYLPFLLQEKGAALTTVGLALSLVFIGGALGKAVCGRLGERLGVTRTVLLTETGTAVAILAVIALPLAPALILLPLLGVMLNGTSSVLYGTVPELAPGGRVERAFAVFYTCTLGGSALAAPLLYGRLGDAAGPRWAAVAAAGTALAVVPLMLALSPHLARGREARRF
ncbi:MFS transporter [Methylobacterium brachiatum]|uniref:MFS transporter n=1 Tax=Methylobacterium brachiatum TaxID=269660 RepID=UPI0008EB2662|nr:MFS transporter [Methylobacterium brachiatum]SFI46343.1 Predicted arabinose efflux permease, MFS family [Methylobacterium brachiatum]